MLRKRLRKKRRKWRRKRKKKRRKKRWSKRRKMRNKVLRIKKWKLKMKLSNHKRMKTVMRKNMDLHRTKDPIILIQMKLILMSLILTLKMKRAQMIKFLCLNWKKVRSKLSVIIKTPTLILKNLLMEVKKHLIRWKK